MPCRPPAAKALRTRRTREGQQDDSAASGRLKMRTWCLSARSGHSLPFQVSTHSAGRDCRVGEVIIHTTRWVLANLLHAMGAEGRQAKQNCCIGISWADSVGDHSITALGRTRLPESGGNGNSQNMRWAAMGARQKRFVA